MVHRVELDDVRVKLTVSAVLILLFVRTTNAFPQYVALIPNGHTFPALGHVDGIGGGALSSFGKI